MTDIIRSPEFEEGIRANPNDSALRLRYAKWLREQGNADWADFIEAHIAEESRTYRQRVDMEIADSIAPEHHSFDAVLEKSMRLQNTTTMQQLLVDTQAELLARGIDRPLLIDFAGGMPGGSIAFDAPTLMEHGETIFKDALPD